MSSLAKIKNRCFGYQQLIPLIKPSKTKKLQYPSNKSTKTNFKKPSPTKYRMKKSNSQKKIPNINPILTNLNFKHKLTKNHSYKLATEYNIVDEESLYNKNIQLQTEINKMKQELLLIKCENSKKDSELIKKDKLLSSALELKNTDAPEINNYINPNKNMTLYTEEQNLINGSIKDNLLSKFRMQYLNLKKDLTQKEEEINELKKNIKISKLKELMIENSEILKNFNKLKNLFQQLSEENTKNKNKLKKYINIENQLAQKNLIILQLQESLKSSSSDNIKCQKENENLKSKIKNLEIKNETLSEKIKNLYETYNSILSSKKEIENKYFMLQNEYKKNEINFNNTNKDVLNLSNSKNIPNKLINSNIIRKSKLNEMFEQDLNLNLNEESENNKNEENELSQNTDITELTYLLVKNFEACKIAKEDSLTLIIKPILNDITNEKQISKEVLVDLFTVKICECINCSKNDDDIKQITNFINSMLIASNNELLKFIENFLHMFDGVKIYQDNSSYEENIIKKINISLFQYKEYFQNSYKEEFISFFLFRKLLNNKNIVLDDESIEYLIYRMKKDCPNIIARNNNEINIAEKNENNNKENKNENIINNNDGNLNEINNGKTVDIDLDQTEELIHINKESISNENIKEKNNNMKCTIFDLCFSTFLNLL